MSRVLMIGAGGVATVAAFKIVQNQDVFTEFMIASRRKEKCDKLVKDIHAKGYKMDIQTAEVDADDVEQLKALFNSYKPELVINLALPYQDLTIMDACLACGCNYMDTANYEPKDEAHFEYSWQWAYKDKFEQAGLCAILGCGFDPGVSGIFTAYAAKQRARQHCEYEAGEPAPAQAKRRVKRQSHAGTVLTGGAYVEQAYFIGK